MLINAHACESILKRLIYPLFPSDNTTELSMLHGFHKLTWALMLICTAAYAQPAFHAFDIAVPSGRTPLLRPNGVYVDPRTQELYVADTGNSRIVIFDRDGHFDFAFSDSRHLNAPKQIAVDSLGRIFVLSEAQVTALSVFDYNGDFIRELVLRDLNTTDTLRIAGFLIDSNDRIFAASVRPAHIYAFDTEGRSLFDFQLFADHDSTFQMQSMLGNISIVNGDLMIPLPLEQAVARYTLDGTYVTTFGIPGGGPKELGFPIAVTGDGHGGILVLDRMRSTILHYDNDGKTVEERGGMGISDGWFYLPGAMTSRSDGVCYIAQMFNSRVQAVRMSPEIPDTDANYAAEDKGGK